MATSEMRSSDASGLFARLPYGVRVLLYKAALSRVDALDINIFSLATSPGADTPIIPTAQY